MLLPSLESPFPISVTHISLSMESTDCSSVDSSSKAKKILASSSKPSSSSQNAHSKQPHPDPWSSKTPEKATIAPRRIRNRGSALSLKEVRETAQKLQQTRSDLNVSRPDPLMTAAMTRIPLFPESSPTKLKKPDTSIKLPERYEILDKFFSSLDCSIRLLRMKGSTTTFTKISPKIECLTDRRFTYSHLAQLKFILPEAFEIKKILTHDERTNCMKPDLYISLHIQAIQNDGKVKSPSGNVELRKVFRSRLLDFFKAHPEVDDIPEEALPEPFNLSKKNTQTNLLTTSDSSVVGETTTVASLEQQPTVASHFARSFTRRFSRQVPGLETGQIKQQERIVAGHTSVLPFSGPQIIAESKSCISASIIPVGLSSKAGSNVESSSNTVSLAGMPLSPPPATPVKDLNSCKGVDYFSKEPTTSQGTPSQPVSTPAKLMNHTPAQQTPKRCYMSPDDDCAQPTNKLMSRPSRSRSLKFDTPVKSAKVEDDVREGACSAVDNDVLDILPENLIQSIREKERKALLEQDSAISEAKWRQQMLASLPKLFDMIYFLFQSIRRSVMTKEELMHKVVSSQLNIVDRREVEEQLRLLRELVPEWIYEKSSSNGDILLCVNKIPSPELVRNRLAEVK